MSEIKTDAEGRQYIDMTPTPDGFRAMKRLFVESAESWDSKLKELDQMEEHLKELSRLGGHLDLSNEQDEMLYAGLDMIRQDIRENRSKLQESIDELERCGY